MTPGGSITQHIYNKQYTQYIESTILEVPAVPLLRELYPDNCLTTEGKARKKTSVRVTQYKKNEQAQRTNIIQEQQQAPHEYGSSIREHEQSKYKYNEQAPEP